MPGVRFAGVMKAKGISYEGVGKVATFVIEKVSPLDHRRTKAFSKIYTDWSPGDHSGSDKHQTKRIIARLACYILET